MCRENDHKCKYCGRTYHCDLNNKLCPTINFDIDANMCSFCKRKLEHLLNDPRNFNKTIDELLS